MDQELVDAAIKARNFSYSPYSKFAVGVALRLKNNKIFSGTNVENCSYGLTVCAERHAIAAARMGGANPGDVVSVYIVSDTENFLTPCGACRQVLAEFAAPGMAVTSFVLGTGASKSFLLEELLPEAFDSNFFDK